MLQVRKPLWRSGDLSEALLLAKGKGRDLIPGVCLPLENKAPSEILFGRWCWGLVLKLHLCNKLMGFAHIISLTGGGDGNIQHNKMYWVFVCGSWHRAPKILGFPE